MSNAEDKKKHHNEGDDNSADKALAAKLQKATIALVRASNALPKAGSGGVFELYASYPLYTEFLQQQQQRVLTAMRKIMANSGCRVSISPAGLDDMEKIVGVNDLLVERVGTAFDEHQRQMTQERLAVHQPTPGAEQVAGSATTLSLAASQPGVQDGMGRYSQVSRGLKRTYDMASFGADAGQGAAATSTSNETTAPATTTGVTESSTFDAEGYRSLCSGRRFNNRQLFAMKQLWTWRYKTAQQNEKAPSFVLPDHMMLQIAEVLPREMQGVIACCSPVPIYVQHDVATIHRYILAARDLPLEKQSVAPLLAEQQEAVIEELVHEKPPRPSYHFDCSAAGKPLLLIEDRLKSIGDRLTVPKLKNHSEAPFVFANMRSRSTVVVPSSVADGPASFSFYADDNRSKKESKAIQDKVSKVSAQINEWTTPFESYTLAKNSERVKQETGAND